MVLKNSCMTVTNSSRGGGGWLRETGYIVFKVLKVTVEKFASKDMPLTLKDDHGVFSVENCVHRFRGSWGSTFLSEE